ncbi:hypothetical protein Pres01_03620 [Metapseudomonas resinovorans]|uniref:DUF2889 domain-containing protein n=1 Tax=Metapseudomonas resinovorans TaxID=53412 RepID=UPI001F3F6ACD|nr:DUF2889 domain-containing protein [Pseudomonas resinovorans]GLZ84311.1 hypothetical protein Pres01_03620 [Pseudomonas resinovorans]
MLESMPERPGRRLLHTRRVDCTGYVREDDLFEFEGWLLDTKTHDIQLSSKAVAAGEPVHDLGLRLTLDRGLLIRAVEVLSRTVPNPACTQVNAAYAGLVGLKIGPGFKRQVVERVGGVRGCTHLTELLGPLATTVLQTLSLIPAENDSSLEVQARTRAEAQRWVIGTCHVYRPDGELVRKLWPEIASAPAPHAGAD